MMKFNTKLTVLLATLFLAGGALVGCKKPEPTPEPTLYHVVPATEEGQGYEINGIVAAGYEAGAKVSFTITVDHPEEKEISKVRYTVGKDEFEAYLNEQKTGYEFTMPSNNVGLHAVLRNVDKYNIQLNGEAAKGMIAEVNLLHGNMPIISYAVKPATASDAGKLLISGKKVQFLAEGPVGIAATINNEVVATLNVTVTNLDHGQSPIDPLTIDQAVEICKELPESTSTTETVTSEIPYYVGGVVTKITENDPSFSNATVNFGEFIAYRCYFDANVDRSLLDLGSYVVFHAYLVNYKGTYETSNSSDLKATFVSIDNSTVRYIDVDPARSVQLGQSIDIRYELKPSSAPAPAVEFEVEDTKIAAEADGQLFGLIVGETKLKVKCGAIESAEMIVKVVNEEVHGETPDDPISAAEAVEICKTTGETVTKTFYYIKDEITGVTENNYSFQNATCVLAGKFTVYRSSFGEGFDRDNVCVGAIVTIRATIFNYSGSTPETSESQFIDADVSTPKGVYIYESVKTGRLQVGTSEKLNAYVEPLTGGFDAIFSSSDGEVATVSSKGKITALKAGETDITIKYEVKDEQGEVVQVFEESKHYVITDEEPVWPAGDHISNPFTVDEAIAKCQEIGSGGKDEQFYIKGELTELGTITTSYVSGAMNNSDASAKFTLYRLPSTSAFKDEITVGVTLLFKCYLVNYSSSTPENDGNRSSTGVIEVYHKDLEGIALNEEAITIAAEKTSTLILSPVPAGALLPDAKWESSDEAVATVDGGVVTGVSEGTATIKVTAGEFEATCEVTVLPKGSKFEKTFELPADLFQKAATSNPELKVELAEYGITVTIEEKGGGSNSGLVALYKHKTITFEVMEGKDVTIRKVVAKCISGYGPEGFYQSATEDVLQDNVRIEGMDAIWEAESEIVGLKAERAQVRATYYITIYAA